MGLGRSRPKDQEDLEGDVSGVRKVRSVLRASRQRFNRVVGSQTCCLMAFLLTFAILFRRFLALTDGGEFYDRSEKYGAQFVASGAYALSLGGAFIWGDRTGLACCLLSRFLLVAQYFFGLCVFALLHYLPEDLSHSVLTSIGMTLVNVCCYLLWWVPPREQIPTLASWIEMAIACMVRHRLQFDQFELIFTSYLTEPFK